MGHEACVVLVNAAAVVGFLSALAALTPPGAVPDVKGLRGERIAEAEVRGLRCHARHALVGRLIRGVHEAVIGAHAEVTDGVASGHFNPLTDHVTMVFRGEVHGARNVRISPGGGADEVLHVVVEERELGVELIVFSQQSLEVKVGAGFPVRGLFGFEVGVGNDNGVIDHTRIDHRKVEFIQNRRTVAGIHGCPDFGGGVRFQGHRHPGCHLVVRH